MSEFDRSSRCGEIENIERLADEIYEAKVADSGNAKHGGELLIVGSGICVADLTSEVRNEIKHADTVFYCVYDPLTKIYISSMRPDAMDLSAFYKEGVDRYYTYIQMAEAMLHEVRMGRRVLAIYYGHPGIFAAPTHRAIRVARHEGYSAKMRPGISALDHLVADLGIDPALPGMLNYEATDMLLQQRRIDPSLHVVIWQVGVVGHLGWSPEGFDQSGLSSLVDYLEVSYGGDWPVVNYIAPTFPTVDPVTKTHSILSLREAEVQQTIISNSTFYVPPQQGDFRTPIRHKDTARPEKTARDPAVSCAEEFYGPREQEAIRLLKQFKVRRDYRPPRRNKVSDFMLALLEDGELQRSFLADAQSVLQSPRFSSLTEREQRLLSIPHTLAMEVALNEAMPLS